MRKHSSTKTWSRVNFFSTWSYACVGFFLFTIFLFLFPYHNAVAATKKVAVPAYRAQVTGRSPDFVQADTQGTVVITVDVINTGSKTWKAKGNTLTALNTAKLIGATLNVNKSTKFYDKSWGTSVRPTALTKDVKPGETAHLTFTLRAPKKAGEYTERFALAVKGGDFIKGSDFQVLFIAGTPTKVSYSVDPGLNGSATYTMEPGKAKTFTLTVTNTGTTT